MNTTLKLFLLILLLFQLLLIIRIVHKKKLSMKYASFWIFLLILMSIIVIFPSMIFKLSELFGFEVASNMILLIGFFFLFYLIFILTISLSVQNENIKSLIQEISMLKERVDKDEKRK